MRGGMRGMRGRYGGADYGMGGGMGNVGGMGMRGRYSPQYDAYSRGSMRGGSMGRLR
jgi:hypothetical protein